MIKVILLVLFLLFVSSQTKRVEREIFDGWTMTFIEPSFDVQELHFKIAQDNADYLMILFLKNEHHEAFKSFSRITTNTMDMALFHSPLSDPEVYSRNPYVNFTKKLIHNECEAIAIMDYIQERETQSMRLEFSTDSFKLACWYGNDPGPFVLRPKREISRSIPCKEGEEPEIVETRRGDYYSCDKWYHEDDDHDLKYSCNQ